MDFEITIGTETTTFEQHQSMLAFLAEKTSHWNNFDNADPLFIRIRKVPSKTSTVGVVVSETLDLTDRLA